MHGVRHAVHNVYKAAVENVTPVNIVSQFEETRVSFAMMLTVSPIKCMVPGWQPTYIRGRVACLCGLCSVRKRLWMAIRNPHVGKVGKLVACGIRGNCVKFAFT